jgi:hypothetical protein
MKTDPYRDAQIRKLILTALDAAADTPMAEGVLFEAGKLMPGVELGRAEFDEALNWLVVGDHIKSQPWDLDRSITTWFITPRGKALLKKLD